MRFLASLFRPLIMVITWFANLGSCPRCGGRLVDRWKEMGWPVLECDCCGAKIKY